MTENTFRVQKTIILSHLDSELTQLKHKSGARVFIIANSDKENSFTCGFNTYSTNERGTAHVLEHLILCSSKCYNSEDVFMELQKGNFYSYLNAITYPHRTVYPFASRNEQDFFNIMQVYLNCIFSPTFFDNPYWFSKEGIRIEKNGYGGVVYNEMQSMFKDLDYHAIRLLRRKLFKHNHLCDGAGNPIEMKGLTNDQIKNFYLRHYRPENAIFCLYGSFNTEKALTLIDEAINRSPCKDYIKRYSPYNSIIRSDSNIFPVSIPKPESLTYASAIRTDFADNRIHRLSLEVLSKAIVGKNKKTAKDLKPLGSKLIFNTDSHIPLFALISNYEKEVLTTVHKRHFRELIGNVNNDRLYSVIQEKTFVLTERDFGYKPFGIVLSLELLERLELRLSLSELFEDIQILEKLGDEIKSGYFERFIKKLLREQIVTVKLTDNKKLKSQRNRLISQADLKSGLGLGQGNIPHTNINEIKKEQKNISLYKNNKTEISFIENKHNSLIYFNIYFQIKELSPLITLFSRLIQEKIKTEHLFLSKGLNYDLTFSPQVIMEDGLHVPMLMLSAVIEIKDVDIFFEYLKKVLNSEFVLSEADLVDIQKQQLFEMKNLVRVGNLNIAIARALSTLSLRYFYKDLFHGIEYFQVLKNQNININDMNQLQYSICLQGKLKAGISCRNDLKSLVTEKILELNSSLRKNKEIIGSPVKNKRAARSELFITDALSTVAFAIETGIELNEKYLLKVIIEQELIWRKIRNELSAYGGGVVFGTNNEICLYSLKNPEPIETIKIFENIFEFLKSLKINNSDFRNYQVAALREIDKRLTPKKELLKMAAIGYNNYLDLSFFDAVKDCKLKGISNIGETLGLGLVNKIENPSICLFGEEKIADYSHLPLERVKF